MVWAACADPIVLPITFASDLTAFPHLPATWCLTLPTFVFVVRMLTIGVRAKATVSRTGGHVGDKAFGTADSLVRALDGLMYGLVEDIGLVNMLNSPLYWYEWLPL